MYESRTAALLSRERYYRRLAAHFCVALLLALASLFIGMLGYHAFEALEWDDAFLNAAMILGGMGPVHSPQTHAGKLFAGFYALYAGLIFLVVVALVLAPMVHRVLHRFHFEEQTRR